MVERPHRFLGGADHRPVDVIAFLDHRHGRDAVDPRLERAPEVGMAAARAVDVGDVHLDVGDSALEAGEPLPDLLLEARVAFIVAGDLVVGMDLDEQAYSPALGWRQWNAGRGG